jgi:hypothetical protein
MKHHLANEIAAFIQNGHLAGDTEFNRLAIALFAYQHERNPPYRRLCESVGISPANVTNWREIPAVPARAFKLFELSCVPQTEVAAVFHSSGTTESQTSRHFFDADGLSLYEESLRIGFDAALGEQQPKLIWAMMPSPDVSPHSSLSHMLGALKAQRFLWDDVPGLSSALKTIKVPILLFGTAFAFVQLFDASDAVWHLPPGSIIVETGGYKGKTRELTREELYSALETRLNVPVESCWSEYGMSEMASQFYGRGLDPVKRGPHWVRTRIIDPETGLDAPTGQPGLLCHYDLANFNSVLAIQTQDMGLQTADGFALQGRLPGAPLRGCSLTVEELWQSP